MLRMFLTLTLVMLGQVPAQAAGGDNSDSSEALVSYAQTLCMKPHAVLANVQDAALQTGWLLHKDARAASFDSLHLTKMVAGQEFDLNVLNATVDKYSTRACFVSAMPGPRTVIARLRGLMGRAPTSTGLDMESWDYVDRDGARNFLEDRRAIIDAEARGETVITLSAMVREPMPLASVGYTETSESK
jgi:hypothetical protein